MSEFGGVYEQHVLRVYGFFAYSVDSRLDAEDLTQQTFERALRGWDRFDESRGDVSPWLLAIARHLLIDHIRASRTPRMARMTDASLEDRVITLDRHNLGVDPELERALGQLGPRERELIALRFGADLTGAEIAAVTGLQLANVQQILSRSLRRMRASLDATLACVG